LSPDQIRIQIILLGFGVLCLTQQKEREGVGIPGGCAGKGLGEDGTNGAAARPFIATKERGWMREREWKGGKKPR
jgi:hypothetical protein